MQHARPSQHSVQQMELDVCHQQAAQLTQLRHYAVVFEIYNCFFLKETLPRQEQSLALGQLVGHQAPVLTKYAQMLQQHTQHNLNAQDGLRDV